MKKLQPIRKFNRYRSETVENTAEERSGSGMNMLRKLIRSAIETFPIDPEKKAALLYRITRGERTAQEHEVL